MNSQHLSDEAVAAFADGVLRGHARDRAARHVEGCADCRYAVRSQREAVLVLRAAPAPPLPSGLFERLQALPSTTAISTLPTAVAADGSTVLSTGFAPMAAFVPTAPAPRPGNRIHPFATGAAVIALAAGALAASSVVQNDEPATAGPGAVSSVEGHDPATVLPQLVGVRFVRR